MEEIIEQYHKGQTRNGGKTPYTVHLYGVESILSSLIDKGGEITDPSLISDLKNGALGHDLLEDTDVPKELIAKTANERTLSLIKEVTNPDDDSHTERYMDQLKNSSEEGRLIKYADLIDNTFSVAYGLQDLGRDWAENFYLPIMKNTKKMLAETAFEKYPKTAKQARNLLDFASNLLCNRLTKQI